MSCRNIAFSLAELRTGDDEKPLPNRNFRVYVSLCPMGRADASPSHENQACRLSFLLRHPHFLVQSGGLSVPFDHTGGRDTIPDFLSILVHATSGGRVV